MRYLFLLVVTLMMQATCAQVVNMTQLTLEHGLPSNETYQVTQDAKGFIWICTDHGVARYNGQTFKSFSTVDGLVENTIFRIYQDYQQRLWFLGMQGSLCYWDGDSIRQVAGNPQIRRVLNKPSIPSNIVVD